MTTANNTLQKAGSFSDRLHTMLRADLRRLRKTPHFFVLLLTAFAMPVLILVMTTMVGGADPQAGSAMPLFRNTWQVIASDSASSMNAMSAMGGITGGTGASDAAGMMDMTAMMNSNLMYFLTAVFVCLFIAEDFRSGYCKNLFTVRAQKTDYVASKTVVGFLAGTSFLLAFLFGACVGGAASGLSFSLGAGGVGGLLLCILAKVGLMTVFAAIFVLMSVIGKGRTWMSVLLSLFAGMLLFMMIPMMSPLDATIVHAGMCLAGGAVFAAGVGAVSNLVLKTGSLA